MTVKDGDDPKDPEIELGNTTQPVAVGQPISSETKLDPATVALLESVDCFYVQQQVRWGEAITQGCFEQPNIYAVMDKATSQKIMAIQEDSDTCSRCCCAPEHSFFAKFYLVDAAGNPTGEPVMTLEREGCDCCCTGPCPKPCICCFACTEGCSDHSSFYAGDILNSKAGELKGQRERTFLLGESIQPIRGGGFKPVMQIMDRGDSPDGSASMFAATRGPCFFGGCSEFCCDSKFGISVAHPGQTVSELHELPFGDFASITKVKPSSFSGAMRELFTDSDTYEVDFVSKDITPQQKANVIATMIHLDYMFFERDNDMIYCDPEGLHIVCCNCFICGCVCPCKLTLSGNSDSGDGGGGGD